MTLSYFWEKFDAAEPYSLQGSRHIIRKKRSYGELDKLKSLETVSFSYDCLPAINIFSIFSYSFD